MRRRVRLSTGSADHGRDTRGPVGHFEGVGSTPGKSQRDVAQEAHASFITTTSALANHWDGATPAKNVFAPESSRNKSLAGEALQLTMGVYLRNVSQGTAATPSPHWVGFTIYHIEKDLSKGLYLQNQIGDLLRLAEQREAGPEHRVLRNGDLTGRRVDAHAARAQVAQQPKLRGAKRAALGSLRRASVR